MENVRFHVSVCCLILIKLYHKKKDMSSYVIVFICVFILLGLAKVGRHFKYESTISIFVAAR